MNTLPKINNHPHRKIGKPRYVVAIGGSAGFLKPLLSMFDYTVPDDVSYVVLRHIGQHVRSELRSILQKHSKLQVADVIDGMPIERNNVYIIPPGFYMTIENGKFYLFGRTGPQNCAVDIFMESLAKDYKRDAIGIILSGMGANGTKGITSIKKAGGCVFAQDPLSCEFDSMPAHAIKSGCVDEVLLPADMPAMITEYVANLS